MEEDKVLEYQILVPRTRLITLPIIFLSPGVIVTDIFANCGMTQEGIDKASTF